MSKRLGKENELKYRSFVFILFLMWFRFARWILGEFMRNNAKDKDGQTVVQVLDVLLFFKSKDLNDFFFGFYFKIIFFLFSKWKKIFSFSSSSSVLLAPEAMAAAAATAAATKLSAFLVRKLLGSSENNSKNIWHWCVSLLAYPVRCACSVAISRTFRGGKKELFEIKSIIIYVLVCDVGQWPDGRIAGWPWLLKTQSSREIKKRGNSATSKKEKKRKKGDKMRKRVVVIERTSTFLLEKSTLVSLRCSSTFT